MHNPVFLHKALCDHTKVCCLMWNTTTDWVCFGL